MIVIEEFKFWWKILWRLGLYKDGSITIKNITFFKGKIKSYIWFSTTVKFSLLIREW